MGSGWIGVLLDKKAPVEERVAALRRAADSDSTEDLTEVLRVIDKVTRGTPLDIGVVIGKVAEGKAAERVACGTRGGVVLLTWNEKRKRPKVGEFVMYSPVALEEIVVLESNPVSGEVATVSNTYKDVIEVEGTGGVKRLVVRADGVDAKVGDAVEVVWGVAVRRIGKSDGLKFVDETDPPDVVRIADPHPIIGDVERHMRMVIEKPKEFSRWRLPMTFSILMEGVTGSGKSLSVLAMYSKMKRLMEDNGKRCAGRCFRLSASRFLSMWLGESDKNLARFFAEVEETASDGYPVLAVIEEVDSIAARRGVELERVHDRILATALQRLDKTRPELARLPIVFIATTNTVESIDPAFVRRIGGRVIRFGNLSRRGFGDVLKCRTEGLDVKEDDIERVAESLYGRRFAAVLSGGRWSPLACGDLATGAIVDRAVEEASRRCMFEGLRMDAKVLEEAFVEQYEGLKGSLVPENFGMYCAKFNRVEEVKYE